MLAGSAGVRLDGQLQRRAIRAVNGPATVAHLDDAGLQDHLSRLTGVAIGGYTPGGAVSGLVTSAILQLQGLAALAVLAVYHWWLALGLLAASAWWGHEGRRAYLGQTAVLAGQGRALRRAWYLSDLVLLPAGVKEIRLFGLTGWLTERFRAEWDTSMDAAWRRREERTAPAIAALVVSAVERDAARVSAPSGADRQSLVIPAARSLAVVGVNGAGKTTLIKLLCRLYDPDEGTIRIGAASLRDLDACGWQRQVAAVFQNFQRYEPSARDDIAFGALRLAGDQQALDPAGWQRRVSPAYQDFMRLEFPVRESAGAGDLPRIGQDAPVHAALARALIRGESPLVVFDEPTAALDALAEKQLFGGIVGRAAQRPEPIWRWPCLRPQGAAMTIPRQSSSQLKGARRHG